MDDGPELRRQTSTANVGRYNACIVLCADTNTPARRMLLLLLLILMMMMMMMMSQ